jgi:hypothetical protein
MKLLKMIIVSSLTACIIVFGLSYKTNIQTPVQNKQIVYQSESPVKANPSQSTDEINFSKMLSSQTPIASSIPSPTTTQTQSSLPTISPIPQPSFLPYSPPPSPVSIIVPIEGQPCHEECAPGLICRLTSGNTYITSEGGICTKPPNYWNGIVPGKTTQVQITQLLGIAKSSGISEVTTKYEYASDQPLFSHWITINNSSKLVTSVFYTVGLSQTKNLSEFTSLYGQPEKEMFSNFQDGVKVYIWPSVGLEVFADSASGKTYFIRFFVPTNLNDFLNLYGKGLSEQNPYVY